MDKLKELAQRLNAQLGASRGLVDMNAVPYDLQIGLTGKTVSPKVYIAIGISGAVHHTCAIEGSNTVIAINPDKNARIFEYADYGIVAEF
jgi:electron transfer flavoprotein alpha subunit